MTSIQLVSDVHLETRPSYDALDMVASWTGLDDGGKAIDILVLAGDIYVLRGAPGYRKLISELTQRYAHIVHVNGNHEYYRCLDIPSAHQVLDDISADFPTFHHLNNTHATVCGLRFFGGTMWFPRPTPAQYPHRMSMNDFHLIPGIEPFCYEQHGAFVGNLIAGPKPDVVVSHHLPSNMSVDPQYAGSILNPYFVADVEEHIESVKPPLWLHGHTHTTCDYRLHSTRVVCNPTGYPGEKSDFPTKCVITVP